MTSNRYVIESVKRSVQILRALSERDVLDLDSAAEIAGSAKSSAFRMLETLRSEGLVARHPVTGYVAGPELMRLGLRLLGKLDVANVAAEPMRELWLRTGETVGLALLAGSDIVLAEVLESPSPFRMAEHPGISLAPTGTALGRAILAHLPGREVARLIHGLQAGGGDGSDRHDPAVQALQPRLDRVRSEGFADDIEESDIGVACVAAPIFAAGRVAGGISIAGPRVRMTDDRIREFGALVADISRQVSAQLSTASPLNMPA